MASHLSPKKKFWAKDMGNKGIRIYDLTQQPNEIIEVLPKTEDKKILEKLEQLDKSPVINSRSLIPLKLEKFYT